MSTSLVAPIRSVQVDDIDIHFNESLYDAKYYLYGQEIHSIWIRGNIISLDYDNQCFDIDDNLGRILRIQFDLAYILPQILDKTILNVRLYLKV